MMTTPCSNCPFRREGGIRLRPARARELAENATAPNGGHFACHKTVTRDDEGEASHDGEMCAGALAFATKLDSFNQLMRICGRLGLWDPAAIQPAVLAAVFNSVEEMVEAQAEMVPNRKKPARKPAKSRPRR